MRDFVLAQSHGPAQREKGLVKDPCSFSQSQFVHYTDGKDETFVLEVEDNGFSEPERPHVTENAESKPVKFLLVELKEHPHKPAK